MTNDLGSRTRWPTIARSTSIAWTKGSRGGVFGQRHPTAEGRKAFGDVVVDRLCRLAGERNVPVQMHLVLALVRGSHPINAAGLIEPPPRHAVSADAPGLPLEPGVAGAGVCLP